MPPIKWSVVLKYSSWNAALYCVLLSIRKMSKTLLNFDKKFAVPNNSRFIFPRYVRVIFHQKFELHILYAGVSIDSERRPYVFTSPLTSSMQTHFTSYISMTPDSQFVSEYEITFLLRIQFLKLLRKCGPSKPIGWNRQKRSAWAQFDDFKVVIEYIIHGFVCRILNRNERYIFYLSDIYLITIEHLFSMAVSLVESI